MGKGKPVTCTECYFRCAGLCALPGDDPCPTFRPARREMLVPPKQPMLVPRPPVQPHAA